MTQHDFLAQNNQFLGQRSNFKISHCCPVISHKNQVVGRCARLVTPDKPNFPVLRCLIKGLSGVTRLYQEVYQGLPGFIRVYQELPDERSVQSDYEKSVLSTET